MRFRSLSQNCGRARQMGVSGGVSMLLGTTLGATMCAGALLVGPLVQPLQAAPTVGGDENGPQVQILQPGYQDVLKGKTKILIAVRSKKFNPEFVEMFIDDKPATTGPIPVSALPSAQYDWDTKLFVDGPHKLTVRVTDTQGFRGWAEVNVFINNDKKIDSLPPSLSWLNAKSYQQLSGKAQIQLEAVDNFGVKWIIVSVNPASDPNKKPASRSWLLNRPPYIVNFDTTKVPDGLYQLSAKAWDSFEQEGLAEPLTIGIVNNAINATTQSEMLEAMRRIEEAKSKTAPAAKATPRFTVPTPDSETTNASSGGYSTSKSTTNAGTASAPAPNAAKAPTAKAPTAAKPNVVVKAGAAAPKAPLLPSAPPMVVRSVQGNAKATGSSALNTEIEEAVKDDGRTRTAKVTAPESGERPTVAQAQLSTSGADKLAGARAGAAAVKIEEAPRLASVRSARPADISRDLTATADAALSSRSEATELSVTGSRALESAALTTETNAEATPRLAAPQGEVRQITGGPVLSQDSNDNSPSAALGSPLKVESEGASREGRVSGPETLVARTEVRTLAEPSLSSPTNSKGSRIADRVVASTPVESGPRIPSRLAAPSVSEERIIVSHEAQLSAPTPVQQPKASAKWPIFAKAQPKPQTAKTPSKVASPAPGADKTRISALPRPQKSNAKGAITAITVSPLEVKTSTAIPAFHSVTRSTDLRAVAARYGLPVEVVAACNGWSADKALAVGTNVKLPQQLEVAYQGVPVRGDAPSMLVGGTGVTAFRFMFEQAGGKLEWDAKKQRVIAKKGESEVTLTIGSNKAKVGDKEVMMELAAFLFEGRTMVPVRFFEEGLDAQVEWDPQTGRLVVAMAN